uniref:Uncharacterized protein T32O22.13 n=2 Tax=Arabidopsis thaliana TaxID=3702 RepID=Q9AUZ0_ARATH|nr:hypothetical protein [Arabidopsis thaliana]
MSSISSPYLFMKWSMDVVGPMEASGGKKKLKNLLVLTDYSTKWIEAKAFQQVTEKQVEDFLWENIVCQHGIPYEIITDNGTNLTSRKIKAFCDKWKIRLTTSTPHYPQGNGQAEAANKAILSNIKKILDSKKSMWSDVLHGVLWAYRTTPRKSTQETPFSLAYGLEAVIPIVTIIPSVRRTASHANSDMNTQMLRDNMDFIDERRDQAMIRVQNYQQAVTRYYNSNIKIRRFEVGELVLRKVFSNTRELNAGKLGTN